MLVAGCLAAPPSSTGGNDDDGGPPGGDGSAAELEPLCQEEYRVSHWRFDGDLTAEVADSIGANHGAIVNSAPLPVPGRFGQAGEFHSEPTGFVLIPDDDSLDLRFGSLEIWTLFHDTTFVVVVARDAMFNPASDDNGHLRIRYAEDRTIHVRLQDAGGEVMLVSGGQIAVNEWSQIVVNWGVDDGGGPRAQLYLDGQLEADTSTPFNWGGAINPLVFGTDQDNAPAGEGTGTPTQYLDGAIDEIVLCRAPVSF